MNAEDFYIAVARREYVEGRWTLAEFESTVDVVLRGGSRYLREKLTGLRADIDRLELAR